MNHTAHYNFLLYKWSGHFRVREWCRSIVTSHTTDRDNSSLLWGSQYRGSPLVNVDISDKPTALCYVLALITLGAAAFTRMTNKRQTWTSIASCDNTGLMLQKSDLQCVPVLSWKNTITETTSSCEGQPRSSSRQTQKDSVNEFEMSNVSDKMSKKWSCIWEFKKRRERSVIGKKKS